MIWGIHIQTHRLVGFMKYSAEMGTDAMMYTSKFNNEWFRHSKFDRGIFKHKVRMVIS
jgi:hypothetical protein